MDSGKARSSTSCDTLVFAALPSGVLSGAAWRLCASSTRRRGRKGARARDAAEAPTVDLHPRPQTQHRCWSPWKMLAN